MKKLPFGVIVVFAFVTASVADGATFIFPRSERHILPSTPGISQVKACRPIPAGISGVWEPSESDIDLLEEYLLRYLASVENGSAVQAPPPRSYGRQYIGIRIKGRRLIYGNFYPESSDPKAKLIESTRPVVSCDGGLSFWGIVFDPHSRKFSDFQYNGDI
jgi:hypothetical protein